MDSRTSASGATFSVCRRYRYRLWRSWGDRENRVVFVGINPSSANEVDNDHTITKCLGFGGLWGFGAIDMVNPFAFVSTDQRGLLDATDPIGPENDRLLADVFAGATRVVWAWGQGKTVAVRKLLKDRLDSASWRALVAGIRCETGTFGITDEGYPRHPLMLPYTTGFQVSK